MDGIMCTDCTPAIHFFLQQLSGLCLVLLYCYIYGYFLHQCCLKLTLTKPVTVIHKMTAMSIYTYLHDWIELNCNEGAIFTNGDSDLFS